MQEALKKVISQAPQLQPQPDERTVVLPPLTLTPEAQREIAMSKVIISTEMSPKTAIWELMKDRKPYTCQEVSLLLEQAGFSAKTITNCFYALRNEGWFTKFPNGSPRNSSYTLSVTTKRPNDGGKTYTRRASRSNKVIKKGEVTVLRSGEFTATVQEMNDSYLEAKRGEAIPSKNVPIPPIAVPVKSLEKPAEEFAGIVEVMITIDGRQYTEANARKIYEALHKTFGALGLNYN